MHKFVLLITAFVSQDEQFMWMQEERVENFRKTGIDRKAFNMILEHIREACDALQIDSRARDMLLEDLICLEDLIYGVRSMGGSEGSIGEMFDERQAFETRLIKEFYTALDRNVELRKMNVYQTQDERLPLVNRISKII